MSSNDERAKWWKVLVVCAFVLAAAMAVGSFVRANNKAAHIEAELRQEFRVIATPSGALLIGEESLHKPGSTFVGHTYSVSSDMQMIRRFYERELTSRGWIYHTERGSGSEVVIEYCKGSYAAKVDYFASTDGPTRYTLYLDWGINDCV
jgi:hypothetical protein